MRQLLWIGCLFILNQVTAQESSFQFGIKAGINLANMYGDPESSLFNTETDNIAQLHFGGFLVKTISNKLSLKSEILYSVKGADFKENNLLFGANDAQVRLHYLSVPILLAYDVQKFQIEVGPEIGFKLATSVEGNNINATTSESLWDQSIDLGVGAGLSFQHNKLNYGLRYTLGLLKLTEELSFTDVNGVPISSERLFKNKVFQLFIGYLLN